MQKVRVNDLVHFLQFWLGLVACGVIIVFLALPSALAQAQAADPQPAWIGGFGEAISGQDRLLSNVDDSDGDGISDAEEGDEILPGTYGQEAYMNPNLCTLITNNGARVSMKINKGRFRAVHMMPDNDPNRPTKQIDDPEFPYGFISFRIEGLSGTMSEGDEVQLKILFPEKVSSYARLCRYQAEYWQAQIVYDIVGRDVWRYDSEQSIALTLIDNDYLYDSDINEVTGHRGVIDGIWGLGIPKGSDSEGRCFIQALPGFSTFLAVR